MRSIFSALTLLALVVAMSSTALAGSPSAKIDQILDKTWNSSGLKPNKPASDEVFLRRIYLDVIGRIPTAEEAERFYADKSSDKRAKLIDTLLESEGYVNHHFNYFINHPASKDKPIEYWIARMQEARDYFQSRNDVSMIRFIDGTCAVTTLFHSGLYRMVYKNPATSFENPLQPLAAIFAGSS